MSEGKQNEDEQVEKLVMLRKLTSLPNKAAASQLHFMPQIQGQR